MINNRDEIMLFYDCGQHIIDDPHLSKAERHFKGFLLKHGLEFKVKTNIDDQYRWNKSFNRHVTFIVEVSPWPKYHKDRGHNSPYDIIVVPYRVSFKSMKRQLISTLLHLKTIPLNTRHFHNMSSEIYVSHELFRRALIMGLKLEIKRYMKTKRLFNT